MGRRGGCRSAGRGDPSGVSTSYLTQGLFRYVGKLPPPLVAYMLARYASRGDTVLDPMCGGGTTTIEAVSSGRTSLNFDVNPVARLVTEAVATPEPGHARRVRAGRAGGGAAGAAD